MVTMVILGQQSKARRFGDVSHHSGETSVEERVREGRAACDKGVRAREKGPRCVSNSKASEIPTTSISITMLTTSLLETTTWSSDGALLDLAGRSGWAVVQQRCAVLTAELEGLATGWTPRRGTLTGQLRNSDVQCQLLNWRVAAEIPRMLH